jgi:hypothetical protein
MNKIELKIVENQTCNRVNSDLEMSIVSFLQIQSVAPIFFRKSIEIVEWTGGGGQKLHTNYCHCDGEWLRRLFHCMSTMVISPQLDRPRSQFVLE